MPPRSSPQAHQPRVPYAVNFSNRLQQPLMMQQRPLGSCHQQVTSSTHPHQQVHIDQLGQNTSLRGLLAHNPPPYRPSTNHVPYRVPPYRYPSNNTIIATIIIPIFTLAVSNIHSFPNHKKSILPNRVTKPSQHPPTYYLSTKKKVKRPNPKGKTNLKDHRSSTMNQQSLRSPRVSSHHPRPLETPCQVFRDPRTLGSSLVESAGMKEGTEHGVGRNNLWVTRGSRLPLGVCAVRRARKKGEEGGSQEVRRSSAR